ncbi:ABC transporter ATP-binding protein [Halosolutus gelatinilyticus]|uniref:ABC transporter ATP-binding protein n=1 Tax=Halosolutus gelatinilyticus TaxID=2931975 RepID=UPI001FF135AE|nr:ATP-binding cassette domain-containing protein [Halosolutus gelatinilyticus]
MPPKLETEDLTRVADGERLVDGVSLAVLESEVLAVVGPSGAGKSSFLRLLNRLDEPTGGTVYLDGTDYRSIEPQSLRRRVGFVPQQPALREGTVRENATLAYRLCDEPIDDERVRRLLAAVDLEGYADRPVDTLSGGERQRVSLVRTLVTEPEVLLLDEPTASLDADTEASIERLLSGLIDDYDLTCLLVTHDQDQARRLGDRVARFEGGEVTGIGTPAEVLA